MTFPGLIPAPVLPSTCRFCGELEAFPGAHETSTAGCPSVFPKITFHHHQPIIPEHPACPTGRCRLEIREIERKPSGPLIQLGGANGLDELVLDVRVEVRGREVAWFNIGSERLSEIDLIGGFCSGPNRCFELRGRLRVYFHRPASRLEERALEQYGREIDAAGGSWDPRNHIATGPERRAQS